MTPALEQLLAWSGLDLQRIGGIAVGDRPGAVHRAAGGRGDGQDPGPGAGRADRGHHEPRRPGVHRPVHVGGGSRAVIDARRGEVFAAVYRAVPGGVVRETDYLVADSRTTWSRSCRPSPEEVLCVGNGAILYRREIEELGSRVEFASPAVAHPGCRRPGGAGRAAVPARGARPAVRRRPHVHKEVGCGDRLGSASQRRPGLT